MSADESMKPPDTEPQIENDGEPPTKLRKTSETMNDNLTSTTILTEGSPTTEIKLELQFHEFDSEKGTTIKQNIEIGGDNLNNSSSTNASESSNETGPKKNPCISVQFGSDEILEIYKEKFVNFFKTFIEFQVIWENTGSVQIFRDENLQPSASDKESGTDTCNAKWKKGSKAKKELFVVDSKPSPNTSHVRLKYTSKSISTEKSVEEPETFKITCFNCDEFHSLRGCPHPKDNARINAVRSKFKSQPKSLRYHLEEEQKFSHLVPGKISHELRKALGLPDDELPPYIYTMRAIGYPPGWLEEAKIPHSNLNIFGDNEKNVKNGTAKDSGIDVNKIVDYPGFNVPFEKGTKDYYWLHNAPPYTEEMNKRKMIDFFEKKELELLNTCNVQIDPAPEEKPNESRDSPSLVDLEQQKQEILEKLNDESKPEDVKNSSSLSVKASCFGTPILKSNSPYMTLPNPDKFSKDVSPVINFENLPNSTGKYEQMTGVLEKVRNTIKLNRSCST